MLTCHKTVDGANLRPVLLFFFWTFSFFFSQIENIFCGSTIGLYVEITYTNTQPQAFQSRAGDIFWGNKDRLANQKRVDWKGLSSRSRTDAPQGGVVQKVCSEFNFIWNKYVAFEDKVMQTLDSHRW